MNVRKKIFISMMTLAIGSCVAILAFSMFFFIREQNDTKYYKVEAAATIMENEFSEMKVRAQVAAFGMANNPELIEAIISNDRESIISLSNSLKSMTQIDFCNIADNEGYVITRTHAPEIYGDNISSQPHVRRALLGYSESFITQGSVIRLGVYAGAPIYDSGRNLIGIVSLGFRLDAQEFAYRLEGLTGCDISAFLHDVRISTTLIDEDGQYALGAHAPNGVYEVVSTGEPFIGPMQIYGNNILAKYLPLFGFNNEIVGMVFVGYNTADDDSKILFFTIFGILITMGVVAICIVIAMYISRTINRRLDDAYNKLASTNKTNELQLVKLNTVVKATKMALWDMEVVAGDPVNPDNNVIWSPEFRGLLGFSNEEEFPNVLNSWSDRLHPEDKERSVDAFANHMLDVTGKTPFDIEYRLLKKDGEYAYFRAAGETVRDENGIAVRVAGSLMDITEELKVLQNKLDIESSTLQTMIDSIPDHVFFKDTDFLYTRANKSLLDHHNITEEDLIGKDDLNGLGVPEMIANEFRNTDHLVISENRIIVTEEKVPASDGSTRYFETSKIPLKQNGNVTGYMGIARDITDRKIMEETAQSANRMKSIFLANMSHEIRTPMNSIVGFSELAQHGDVPEKTKMYLTHINESAQWLLSLVNDILDISKIESGNIELEIIPFHLPEIFVHCQSIIQPKAKEKGITLFCYAEPSVGKKLLGDPVRLRQVIMNLLSNAVKFTNTGTVKLLASIVEHDDKSVKMHFEVRDSGIGMNPAQIEKIFDPFKQADESITRKFGGTGLGLTISKNIIELMGGTLNVESVPGIGSKFSFEVIFEMIDDAEEILTPKAVINDHMKPNFTGEVLICEDNKLNQQVICDHLERVGLRSIVANNGSEGVNAVIERLNSNEKPFDLIFMDIHMPVMDGLDAASKIAEMGTETPIVALTANVMATDIEIYRANGMIDTLGKPFTTNELWRCLINHIPVISYSVINEGRQNAEESKLKKKLKLNFIKENRSTYNDFIRAVKSYDNTTAHRIAHTLKSTAAQIDAYDLREAAAAAESLLEDEGHFTENLFINLRTELEKTLNELAPMLIEEENTISEKVTKKTKSKDAAEIQDLINKLEPLLRDNSTRSLKFLDDILAIPGADEIAFHIEDFNFSLALSELEKLKRELGQ